MANSRARAAERASNRLAMFTQPINKTNPTDPSSTNNRVTVRNYLTEGRYETYRAGQALITSDNRGMWSLVDWTQVVRKE